MERVFEHIGGGIEIELERAELVYFGEDVTAEVEGPELEGNFAEVLLVYPQGQLQFELVDEFVGYIFFG